jgi:Phage-related lysozyme (muraminidase)
MQPSQACIDLVKASEGCRLTAYRDSVGILTIGYGSTGGIKPGQTITQEQAEAMLVDDLDAAAEAVGKLVTVPLTQGQFDALTDFAFNLGAGRLRDSTLLRLLNQGRYGEAAVQFKFWVMAGGHPLPGLVKRRAAERAMFEGTS